MALLPLAKRLGALPVAAHCQIIFLDLDFFKKSL